MSAYSTIFVGLDRHKESITVSYVGADRSPEPICLGPIGTRTSDVDAMVRKLQSKGKKPVFAYDTVLAATVCTGTSRARDTPAWWSHRPRFPQAR